jgi:hypothetical protein
MKKISLFMALTLLVGVFTACEDDDQVAKTAEATITVTYPETYSEAHAQGAMVEMKNMDTKDVYTSETNENGQAVFEEILAGNYNISASQTLTAEEAKVITGIGEELNLNAVDNDITIASDEMKEVSLTLEGSKVGDLVFKEIYYTGSEGYYFSDQFYEIYNNSTEPISVDSLIIADLYGSAGNAGDPTPFQDDKDHVYARNAWMVPGDAEHVLQPGESFIIAQDGINHYEDPNGSENSPVDLSDADYESYVDNEDNTDTDAPGVPNLVRMHYTGGFDWLTPVFGGAYVIFKVDDFSTLETATNPESSSSTEYLKIPVDLVIDGVEALVDENAGDYKRIPASIDAGFTYCNGMYVGESVRRKVSNTINGRYVLQDTNNSTEDFEVLSTPTPRSFE